MSDYVKYEFSRARGVVWVCDIAGSSKYLNNNKSVDDLEEFIQRLHWISSIFVKAAGGEFIKWTGDGFLAWFETPLYRNICNGAEAFFDAAWYLTFLVNITQLGLKPEKGFHIRHGITYEHDALITTINYPDGHIAKDLTGRAVVLAFRLSGIGTQFPCIVTKKELIDSIRQNGQPITTFKKWNPTAEDRLRYFKGERWGTTSIFMSGEPRRRASSLTSIIKKSKRVIAMAEGKVGYSDKRLHFIRTFLGHMSNGPSWCKDVVDEFNRFAKEELFETLKRVISELDNIQTADKGV